MESFTALRIVVALVMLTACSDTPAATTPVPAAAADRLSLERVVSGLRNPVAITHAGDGTNRLFVTLQEGEIVIQKNGALLQTPFLDISSLVSCCGERGLLSVAFHPGYARNGVFFVNYTDRGGDTVVARYSVSSDPDVANPSSAAFVLRIEQPFSNHNGGQLQFGPDGYLYIGMGDGGSGGDPGNRSQTLTTLLGKMLRVDVDRGSPYAIPPDNPMWSQPGARREIWARGLRNPWRFSFDRETGEMFIGDVGQNRFEEIDHQPADSRGGENYGWRRMEGAHCFNPSSNCNDGTLVLPIVEYDRSGGCSVTGGYRYRGRQSPSLDGTYLYGDYCTGTIWGARLDASGSWIAEVLFDTSMQISTFGEDEAGEIYVADYARGEIHRIASRTARKRPARR